MNRQDKIKLILAGLIIAAGIAGFYIIPQAQGLLRVLALASSMMIAAAVVWFSEQGKIFISYAQGSLAEARKVVWPSRKEAMQITALVALFVFVLALFMWLIDRGLAWLFYDIILGRS